MIALQENSAILGICMNRQKNRDMCCNSRNRVCTKIIKGTKLECLSFYDSQEFFFFLPLEFSMAVLLFTFSL